jgi:uncharacterized protein (DUF924 family)
MDPTPAQTVPARPDAVLAYWFSLKSPGEKDDERIRAALGPLHHRAAGGELDDWAEHPRSRLALILLLDQVPRHLFRDDLRTYATDAKAQGLTVLFFKRQDWDAFRPIERFYAAMPFLHAEDRERQRQVNPVINACAEALPDLGFMGRIADLYLETIQRFGRFPHRNDLHGRETTAEEARFLAEEWHPRRRRIQTGEPAPQAASAPEKGGDPHGR